MFLSLTLVLRYGFPIFNFKGKIEDYKIHFLGASKKLHWIKTKVIMILLYPLTSSLTPAKI
jgi:hypothetical protein